jgi:hypothetical protein
VRCDEQLQNPSMKPKTALLASAGVWNRLRASGSLSSVAKNALAHRVVIGIAHRTI